MTNPIYVPTLTQLEQSLAVMNMIWEEKVFTLVVSHVLVLKLVSLSVATLLFLLSTLVINRMWGCNVSKVYIT